jgi:hypothetical protein
MAYFKIMHGLRGCYLPDTCYVVQCKTRRALKGAIEYEAQHLADGGAVGLSARNIASFAARCWHDRNDPAWKLDYVLPYSQERGRHPAFGIMVSRATRADYLEAQSREA